MAERSLQRRQLSNCLEPCSPVLAGASCSTASCVCSLLSSAGSTTVDNCTTCLTTESPSDGAAFHLLTTACSKCNSQCSTVFTFALPWIVGNASCDAQCLCSALGAPNGTAIATCKSCVQSVSPPDVAVINQFEQECGAISATANASPTTSGSLLSTTAVSSAIGTASPTGSRQTTATVASTSQSFARRIGDDASYRWLWLTAFLVGAFWVGALMGPLE